MTKAKKEQQYYNGIAIDSQEELMTVMYIEELMEHGYVQKLERAESIRLSERLENKYTQVVEMKTKSKEVEKNQVLLEEHIYTPEFVVTWTQKGSELFVDSLVGSSTGKLNKPFIKTYGYDTLIEVKPEFDQNSMERLFKINQKWVWDKHEVYINLVKPLKLFEKTFVPKKYLLTATGKPRVIHIPIRSLEDYLKTIQ